MRSLILPLNGPGIIEASRCLAAMLLAVAVFSGAFAASLPQLPEPLSLSGEPRWICTFLALLFGGAGWRGRPPAMDVLALAGAWVLFAVFAVARTVQAGNASFATFESVLLISAMLMAAIVTLDGPAQVRRFLASSAVVVTLVAVAVLTVSAFDASPLPVIPFYASRTFVVGAFICIFLCLAQPPRMLTVIGGAVVATFLVYAGLASIMRAAAVMSILAGCFALPMLMARRQWTAAATVCFVFCMGFGAHAGVHGHAIQQKLKAYAPIGPGITAATSETSPAERLCAQRIESVTGRSLLPEDRHHACNNALLVTDTDARLRLLLHAYDSNRSRMLGSGLGAYEFIEASRPFYPVGRYSYPHNLAAEVFYGTGLAGIALVGLTMLVALAIALRTFMASRQPLAILIAVPVFTGLASLVGGDLYDARLLWLMPVALAALAADETVSS
jgi:hypothetical protein